MEWIWLVLSLAGMAVNGYGTYEARRDLRWVIESGINHGRKAAAKRNLRRDATLLAVMVIYSVHGVIAVTTPPTPSQVTPFLQTYWLYGSQIVVIVMLIALSARGQFEYLKIRHGEML